MRNLGWVFLHFSRQNFENKQTHGYLEPTRQDGKTLKFDYTKLGCHVDDDVSLWFLEHYPKWSTIQDDFQNSAFMRASISIFSFIPMT